LFLLSLPVLHSFSPPLRFKTLVLFFFCFVLFQVSGFLVFKPFTVDITQDFLTPHRFLRIFSPTPSLPSCPNPFPLAEPPIFPLKLPAAVGFYGGELNLPSEKKTRPLLFLLRLSSRSFLFWRYRLSFPFKIYGSAA